MRTTSPHEGTNLGMKQLSSFYKKNPSEATKIMKEQQKLLDESTTWMRNALRNEEKKDPKRPPEIVNIQAEQRNNSIKRTKHSNKVWIGN